MTRTITATFGSKAAVDNVFDDLINDGLPRESIYLDDTAMQVKVMVSGATEREVSAILTRHHPQDMH